MTFQEGAGRGQCAGGKENITQWEVTPKWLPRTAHLTPAMLQHPTLSPSLPNVGVLIQPWVPFPQFCGCHIMLHPEPGSCRQAVHSRKPHQGEERDPADAGVVSYSFQALPLGLLSLMHRCQMMCPKQRFQDAHPCKAYDCHPTC